MAIILYDGFDTLGTNGQDVTTRVASSGYTLVQESGGDPETCASTDDTVDGIGYALVVNSASPGYSNGIVANFANKSALVMGVRFKQTGSAYQFLIGFNGPNNVNAPCNMFRITTTNSGAIGLTSQSGTEFPFTMEINDNGTLPISAPGVVFANTWHFLEAKFTVGGTLTIKIDGTVVINAVNTPNANALSFVNSVEFANNANQGQRVYIDDLYILDQIGASFDDFLGDVVARDIVPNADAGTNQFSQYGGSSGHFSAIDSIPPGGDNSYLYDNVSGDKELFTLPTFSADILDVLAVSIGIRVRKDSIGFQLIAPAMSSSSYEDDAIAVPTFATVPYSYQTFQFVYPTTPAGGAWTTVAAQAAKIGMRIP